MWCDKGSFISVFDDAGNEDDNHFRESNDSKADEGVGDDFFGLLEFAGIAGGSGIRNTTVNDEDKSNGTSNADNPVDSVDDHVARINALVGDAVLRERAVAIKKGEADGVEDDVGGHDNSKTDKSLSEGFFASGDFAWVAGRENIEITAVDDVANNEVGGDDGDVGNDVGNDSPDAGFEIVFVVNINAAVPRGHAEEIVAAATGETVGKSRLSRKDSQSGRKDGCKDEEFFE